MRNRIETGRRLRVRDDLTVLNVLSSDFSQGTGLGAVVRDKLGSDSERFRGVYSIARSPVVGHALRVRVEAAAALIAVGGAAGMGSVGIGHGIGLENIHLIAAVALTVGVERPVPPGLDRALCIAVSRAVLSTAGVVFIPSAAGAHLGQIKGAVLTAWQSRHINVEAQLPTEELHHHIVPIRSEEVESWRGIAIYAVALDVLVHSQRVSGNRHTGGGIVGCFDNTILCTGGFVGAQGRVDTG